MTFARHLHLHMIKKPGAKHVTGGYFGSSLHRMLGKKVKAARNLDFVGKCEGVRRCLYWDLVFNLHTLSISSTWCVCVCARALYSFMNNRSDMAIR